MCNSARLLLICFIANDLIQNLALLNFILKYLLFIELPPVAKLAVDFKKNNVTIMTSTWSVRGPFQLAFARHHVNQCLSVFMIDRIWKSRSKLVTNEYSKPFACFVHVTLSIKITALLLKWLKEIKKACQVLALCLEKPRRS